MRLPALLVPSVLLLGALAGCIGGSSEEADPAGDVCLPEDPLCDTGGVDQAVGTGGGVVEGAVTDESFQPVVGARVVLEELDQSVTTDDTGLFSFSGVPSGTYRVRAERVGFNPAVKSVSLQDGQTVPLDFTLKAVPREVAYHTPPQELKGNWECNTSEVNCGKPIDDLGLSDELGRSANDQYQWTLTLSRKIATVVVEVQWTAKQQTADKFDVTVRNDLSQEEMPLAEAKAAPNPILLRVEQSQLEASGLAENGGSVTLRVDVSALAEIPTTGTGVPGVAFQQDFRVFVSLWYLDPAPDGFVPSSELA